MCYLFFYCGANHRFIHIITESTSIKLISWNWKEASMEPYSYEFYILLCYVEQTPKVCADLSDATWIRIVNTHIHERIILTSFGWNTIIYCSSTLSWCYWILPLVWSLPRSHHCWYYLICVLRGLPDMLMLLTPAVHAICASAILYEPGQI